MSKGTTEDQLWALLREQPMMPKERRDRLRGRLWMLPLFEGQAVHEVFSALFSKEEPVVDPVKLAALRAARGFKEAPRVEVPKVEVPKVEPQAEEPKVSGRWAPFSVEAEEPKAEAEADVDCNCPVCANPGLPRNLVAIRRFRPMPTMAGLRAAAATPNFVPGSLVIGAGEVCDDQIRDAFMGDGRVRGVCRLSIERFWWGDSLQVFTSQPGALFCGLRVAGLLQGESNGGVLIPPNGLTIATKFTVTPGQQIEVAWSAPWEPETQFGPVSAIVHGRTVHNLGEKLAQNLLRGIVAQTPTPG